LRQPNAANLVDFFG